MDDSLATQPGDSLARKPSDTWSSESTVVPDESGCGNCIIDFLHLRPQHAVDAVVDDTTKKGDADVDMMEVDNIVIDASMSEDKDDEVNIDTKKPSAAACQEARPGYPSTPEDNMESRKPSATTPPPLNQRRRDNSLDFITNDPPSAESISAQLDQHSSALSIPTLSRRIPPESLPQSHLISTTNDDDDDAPLLSLNSMSSIHANPNEAMMPPIPRIHLQMRQSNQTSSVHRVTEGHGNRLSAAQQTVETRRNRSGFVPIQQNTKEEEEDDEDEER